MLVKQLKESDNKIISIDLSSNLVNNQCMNDIGDFLSDDEYLECFKLDKNELTDKGIKIISDYLVGNTTLLEFTIGENLGITDFAIPYLTDIANQTAVMNFNLWSTAVSSEKQQEIIALLAVPVQERSVPIKSKAKSAAKIS